MNKIGIFSITLDRLFYTYHCFKILKRNHSISYEHVVIDNGSKDGTYEYLKEEKFNLIRNEENLGITHASKQGFEWLKEKGVDIIIKIDPDAEIITPRLITKIVKFLDKKNDYFAVSPTITGIDNQPDVVTKRVVNGFNVDEVKMIGGIFRMIRMKDFIEMEKKCEMLNDKSFFEYCNSNNLKLAYLTDFKVNHFETTKGQEKRYPKYFAKQYKY